MIAPNGSGSNRKMDGNSALATYVPERTVIGSDKTWWVLRPAAWPRSLAARSAANVPTTESLSERFGHVSRR
jgi:hypothetical protein